jgi:toxin YoeB
MHFASQAWEDYLWWQTDDRKTANRISQLLRDIDQHGHQGIGKPEPLGYVLAGWWSRRISAEHRLVYRCEGETIYVAQCRLHYDSQKDSQVVNKGWPE